MRLCAQNSTATKYFSLTNVAPAKPYLQVSNSYLPLVSTNSTIAGVKLSVVSGNSSYRALDYQSGSGYYNTTSAAVGNLSSTTALTRVSTSGTNYGTRTSTSGTSYLTRASTSGTNYGTRASTSGTSYLTRASTSGTSYLTRASTSGTTYLTRASTSATVTNYTYTSSNASSLGISIYHGQFTSGKGTPIFYGNYASFYLKPGKINPANVRNNNVQFTCTSSGYNLASYITINQAGQSTVGVSNANSYYSNNNIIYGTSSNKEYPFLTALVNPCKYQSVVAANKLNATGSFVYAVSSTLQRSRTQGAATFSTIDMTRIYYSENLVASTWPTYQTRASTSGTNYGTRASTSGTSYLTRASTSGTSYLTRASTSGTTYLTRASTSGTSYLTRASTSGTTYLTRSSTSGYSGKLSSSSSKWA